MRLLIVVTAMLLLNACSSSNKTADQTAANSDRAPASKVACDPNHFSPVYVDYLRQEISAKYGLDFGMRCTEITELPLSKGSSYSHKKGSKKPVPKKEVVFRDSKKKFTYDTEGCEGYRQEACAAATAKWIENSSRFKSQGAEGASEKN